MSLGPWLAAKYSTEWERWKETELKKGAELFHPAGVCTCYGELDPGFHGDQNLFPLLPEGRIPSCPVVGSSGHACSATQR
jgi:hypothetical protein